MSGSPTLNSNRDQVLRWCRWSDACREAAHFLEAETWERPDLPHKLRQLADELDQRLRRAVYGEPELFDRGSDNDEQPQTFTFNALLEFAA
jgi:hypothetical protein